MDWAYQINSGQLPKALVQGPSDRIEESDKKTSVATPTERVWPPNEWLMDAS